MPDGNKWRTNLRPRTYTVCPALWPPWYRATNENCGVRRSTIFPLPSSPHCAPSTAMFMTGVHATTRVGASTHVPDGQNAQHRDDASLRLRPDIYRACAIGPERVH